MRRIVFALVSLLGMVVATAVAAPGASAQSEAELDAIAADLADGGSYLEFSTTDEIDRAITDANGRGIAFAWIDSDANAETLAEDLSVRLGSSAYRTVLVLTNSFVGAVSPTVADATIEEALDASGSTFAGGDVAGGLDRFASALAGTTTATTTGSSDSSSGSSSGGFGFGSFLLLALIGGGGFLLFRNLRGRSKAKKEAEIDLENDRAEIKEQLRDNADHVLNLGDRVIESGRPELMSTYEKASAAYQDVSQSIDTATTAEEVDRLDDSIDEAEWQFESIEAQLEGRPPPPSPREVEADAAEAARSADGADAPAGFPRPPRSGDQPALGPDESVTGAPPPRPRSQPRSRASYPPTRRRRGGGGLGSVLGSILGSIVLGGGGLGGMTGSRRTQRRRSSSGGGFGGGSRGSSRGGGLGGGVLRRGGSTRTRSRSASGSRSTGRRGGGSGGRRL